MPLRGTGVGVGASIGVSVCPADGVVFADLLHEADLRMYDRKGERGVVVREVPAAAVPVPAPPVPG